MKRIGRLLPLPVLRTARAARDLALGTFYRGTARWCPVCHHSSRKFLPFGAQVVRPDARCPSCGALERHRLLWLYLERRTDLLDGAPRRMLHVAPEPCFEPRFRAGSARATSPPTCSIRT